MRDRVLDFMTHKQCTCVFFCAMHGEFVTGTNTNQTAYIPHFREELPSSKYILRTFKEKSSVMWWQLVMQSSYIWVSYEKPSFSHCLPIFLVRPQEKFGIGCHPSTTGSQQWKVWWYGLLWQLGITSSEGCWFQPGLQSPPLVSPRETLGPRMTGSHVPGSRFDVKATWI